MDVGELGLFTDMFADCNVRKFVQIILDEVLICWCVVVNRNKTLCKLSSTVHYHFLELRIEISNVKKSFFCAREEFPKKEITRVVLVALVLVAFG